MGNEQIGYSGVGVGRDDECGRIGKSGKDKDIHPLAVMQQNSIYGRQGTCLLRPKHNSVYLQEEK